MAAIATTFVCTGRRDRPFQHGLDRDCARRRARRVARRRHAWRRRARRPSTGRPRPEERRIPMTYVATASHDTLRRRAAMLASIRDFFAERGVLEVETPALSSADRKSVV